MRTSEKVFCNRTLNLRSIKAIGYDMDYTLIHYHVEPWETLAFDSVRARLLERGWPVEELAFDAGFAIRGLIIDTSRGNIVKANRFGYIKRAAHGRRFLPFGEQRKEYGRTVVDLSDRRWGFMSTFFALSAANLYAQCVEIYDADKLPEVRSYLDLMVKIQSVLDEIHQDGTLKRAIIADPKRFVVRDPLLPRTLKDQALAGKKLMLVTNSEWPYSQEMMTYAFDPYLDGGSWRDLFDLVLVSARKPAFFEGRQPIFEVVDEAGLLKPANGIRSEALAYLGGHVGHVEDFLGCHGSDILYVGDHIYSDVHVSKQVRRWRTALVLRELQSEVAQVASFAQTQSTLESAMHLKQDLEQRMNKLRLERLRSDQWGGEEALEELRSRLESLDKEISEMAQASSQLGNQRWGLLMRTGNDKSHLARQIERHADIYFAKVSDLHDATPFCLFRSHRGTLPHDLRG